MSNFSDFIDNSSQEQSTKVKKEKNDVGKENLEKLIDKYSKYDSNDLMSEFMRLTLEKKQKGELKKDELQSIKQSISPYLNDEQKQNLNSLISMVDNVK